MDFDIYKITNAELSDEERCIGVLAIEPIWGRNLSASEYFQIMSNYYNLNGTILTPAEIGCTLSHIQIYKRMHLTKKAALILESDITLTTDAFERVQEIVKTNNPSFIHLGWHPNIHEKKFFWRRSVAHQIYEVNPSYGFWGAYFYYITPNIALALEEFHNELLSKADDWNKFFEKREIKPLFSGVLKHPVRHGNGLLEVERNKVSEQHLTWFIRKLKSKWSKRIANLFKKVFSKESDIRPADE